MDFFKTRAGFHEISLGEGIKNIDDKYDKENIKKQKYKENNEFIYNFFENNSEVKFTKDEIHNILKNIDKSYVIEYMLKNHPEDLKKYFCKKNDNYYIFLYDD